MEIGGNKKAREFFRQHGITEGSKFSSTTYSSRAAEMYRNKLRTEAEGESKKYDLVVDQRNPLLIVSFFL